MSDNNAYIAENDCRQIVVYDREEAIEMFGEEFLKEYGVKLPEALLKRYKENQIDFTDIQSLLRTYHKWYGFFIETGVSD